MVKTKLVKAAGRYGARYGQRIKRKIAGVENRQRTKQFCPFCQGIVKRLSKGIWKCKKCKRKFAAHAYFIEKGSIIIKKKELTKPSKPLKKPEPKSKKEEKKKPAKKKATKKITKLTKTK